MNIVTVYKMAKIQGCDGISIFAPIYCQIKRATKTGPTFSCTVIPAGGRLFKFSLISMIVFEYRLGKHEENNEKSTSLHTFRYIIRKILLLGQMYQ